MCGRQKDGFNRFIKKCTVMFLVLFGVSILSFILLAASNKDTAELVARRISMNVTPEMVENIRAELGLDKPLCIRYILWIGSFATGDFGISLSTFNPIVEDLRQHLPVTGMLVLSSLVWVIIITSFAGVLSAYKRNSIFDHIIRVLSMVGICIPTFALGIFLLLIFAVYIPVFSVAPRDKWTDYILPSFTLAFPTSCAMVRVFRASLLTELSKDYCIFAKTRGLSDIRILLNHAFRNALPPVITLFFQYIGYQVAGSAVVESLFSLKGIGAYLLSGIFIADTVPTAYCIMIVAVIFVLTNLLADIINKLLCPWTGGENVKKNT